MLWYFLLIALKNNVENNELQFNTIGLLIHFSVGSCKQAKQVEGRNFKCADEFNLLNQETRNFSLQWRLSNPKEISPPNEMPWKYQSAWETGTLPSYAKFSIYPGGGYILNLAKNINDSIIMVNYLDKFQWVDVRTRAVSKFKKKSLSKFFEVQIKYFYNLANNVCSNFFIYLNLGLYWIYNLLCEHKHFSHCYLNNRKISYRLYDPKLPGW